MPAEIKPHIASLADAIATHVSIDGKTGEFKVDPEVFAKTLPEDLTAKQYGRAFEHVTDFFAAGTKVISDLSIPVMKKHKDLEHTAFSVPTVGKDTFNFTFDREQTFTNPANKEKITKYGIANAEHVVHGTKNKGQYGLIKSMVAEQAKAAYGK